MGLLANSRTTQKAGLLNRVASPAPLPSLPTTNANSTQPFSFDTTSPLQITSQAPVAPQPIKLSGETTISKAPKTTQTPLQNLVDKIPSGNVKDIVQGVVDAPKKFFFGNESDRDLIKELESKGLKVPFAERFVADGFLPTLGKSQAEVIDDKAQSLINKGTERNRAYDIASADTLSRVIPKTPDEMKNMKVAKDNLAKLAITPDENSSVRNSNLIHSIFAGLDVTGVLPVGATIENVSKQLIRIAESSDSKVIATELLNMGVPKEKVANLSEVLANVKKPEVIHDLIQGALPEEQKAGLLARGTKAVDEAPAIVTDQATVQQVKNSIAEGENIIRAGTFNGRKLSEEELSGIARAVDNSKAKIGLETNTDSLITREVPKVEPTTAPTEVKPVKQFSTSQEKYNHYDDVVNKIEDTSSYESLKDNPTYNHAVEERYKAFEQGVKDVETTLSKKYGEGTHDLVQRAGLSKNVMNTNISNITEERIQSVYNYFADQEGKGNIYGLSFGKNPEKPFENMTGSIEGGIDESVMKKTKEFFNDFRSAVKNEVTPISEKIHTRTPEEILARKEKLNARLAEISQEGKASKATKTPRTPEEQNNLDGLYAMKDSVENTGFRDLTKYESKRGEFKGQLNTNNGTGKFSKEYDTKLREVFGDHNNRYSSDELLSKYEDLKKSYKDITDEIKRVESTTSVPKSEARKFATIPKEVTSVEAKAEEYMSRVPSKYREEFSSLEDIVERLPATVKEKVNLLDYLRTPERVLNKIGFGREAKVVRKAYEAYIKELPINLEKITEWSKRVPSEESNLKIFQHLDGQKGIVLNATEKEVADEIQSWLKDWAKRLKLPADNQISHYITHIFDKELINKEFDEDLAKIIADKLPSSVYDPFLEKRLGKQGYKQNTWEALDAYTKRATRKANMDPALEMIQNKAGQSLDMAKVEASQFKYIQRYVNAINMRPAEIDNLIDNFVKSLFGYKYGTRPVTYLTKLLRQMTYRGMLGLNPASALRNLSQGINTYAKLGEKYTVVGYAKLFNKGSLQELKDNGVLADSFIQDRALSATKKALETADKGLFALFQTAEYINRGSAYFGAKAKGLAEGMSEEKAIEYAKKMVRDTQFSFGTIDTPVALQNDIVKTLTQFQSYTVKQIEFLTEMVKNKEYMGILRYTLGGLAFTYTLGKAFGMEPSQLIPSFRFDTPPSLKFPYEVTKAVLDSPDKYGQDRDLKKKLQDIGNSTLGLIPAGSQLKKTIQGLDLIRKGGSFDKGGNLQYEAPETTEGKIQAILFGKSSSENAQGYYNKADDGKRDMETIQPYYDEVQRLKKEGKDEEAIAIYDSLGEKGKTVYKKIKAQATAEATKQGKADILPKFQEIRKMKREGKTDEAIAEYEKLTDEEKKYYQLLKKQLDDKPTGELMINKRTGEVDFKDATEEDLPTIKESVYKAFPFTTKAKKEIDEAKIGILKKGKTNEGVYDSADIQGEHSSKGDDFHNFIVKHISPISKTASDFILKHTDFLQNLDSANIDIKTTDPETLAHEMLHQVFDHTAMSGKSPTGEEAGTKFLEAWDKIAKEDQDAPMQMIDEHLKKDYKLDEMAGEDLASERFAYLGEMVDKYGTSVIPKELRPFYQDVFDFPKEPTPEDRKKGFMANDDEKEVADINSSLEKIHAKAENIAPMIDPDYIKVLVDQESSNGKNQLNRQGDQGKYGWLVGFTKDTYDEIKSKSKTSTKWKNLYDSLAGFDTPEDAMKSALIYSQFLLRDHTKEQETGKREWKDLTPVQLYEKYNGGGSKAGVESFKKKFSSL